MVGAVRDLCLRGANSLIDLDAFENHKDVVTDLLETTPNAKGQLLAKVTKLIFDGAALYQQARAQAFITGYFRSPDAATEENINVLVGYIESERGSSFIQGLFESVVRANSQISILLMGNIWGHINAEKRKLSLQELILSNALTQMNDYDFCVFQSIMKLYSSGVKQYIEMNKLANIPEASNVIQKLYHLQILAADDSYVDNGVLHMGLFYYVDGIAKLLKNRLEENEHLIKYYGWLDPFDI